MFTRNYYNALGVALSGVTRTNGIVDVYGSTSDFYYLTTTSNGYTCYRGLGVYELKLCTNQYSTGIVLGTGTTPPTLNDYWVSGELVTNVSASFSTSMDIGEDYMTAKVIITITNTGDSNITIGEVGLVRECYYKSNSTRMCLMERTVLDEPVTIAVGGVGQVVYKLKLNHPTA